MLYVTRGGIKGMLYERTMEGTSLTKPLSGTAHIIEAALRVALRLMQ